MKDDEWQKREEHAKWLLRQKSAEWIRDWLKKQRGDYQTDMRERLNRLRGE